MQLLHFSDLHGSLPRIPSRFRNPETLLVFSGDTFDNDAINNFTPGIKEGGEFRQTSWDTLWNFRVIDREGEARFQDNEIVTKFIPCLLEQGFTLEQIIILAGNHCFCNLEKHFPNALTTGGKTITVQGIKFGLLTGVLFLSGEWNDEVPESEIGNRIRLIEPDIDILVSHCPPYGIGDRSYGDPHIGSQELYTSIFGKSVFDPSPPYFTNLKFHLFGHSHKWPNIGVKKHEINGRIVRFCNAAETRLELLYRD